MLHARHGTGGSLHVKLMLFIMCGKSIRNGHGGILSDRTPCLTRLAAHFFNWIVIKCRVYAGPPLIGYLSLNKITSGPVE